MPSSASIQMLGPYQLEGELGRGGMGIVFRATDTRLGRPVALKVVHRSVAEAIGLSVDDLRARLRNEAQLAARILHPNVVAVFAYDEVGDDAVVAMELVEGPTLADLLQQGMRWSPVDAAAVLAQVADGVAAAHALGIVHRDLKPANLMLSADGRCKVLDFGIAKATSTDFAPAVSRTTFGTVQYMAPEQVLGRPVSLATDVWALGVILYELIVGGAAFGDGAAVTIGMRVAGEEPQHLNDTNIAAQTFGPVVDVLRYALRKRADERFANAAAFAEALRTVAGLQAAPMPTGMWTRAAASSAGPSSALLSTSGPPPVAASAASGPVTWTPVSGPIGVRDGSTASGPVSGSPFSAPARSGPVRATGQTDAAEAQDIGGQHTGAGGAIRTVYPRQAVLLALIGVVVIGGLAVPAYMWVGREVPARSGAGGGFTVADAMASGSSFEPLPAPSGVGETDSARKVASSAPGAVPQRTAESSVSAAPPAVAAPSSRNAPAASQAQVAALAPAPAPAPAATSALPGPPPRVLPRLRAVNTTVEMTEGDTLRAAVLIAPGSPGTMEDVRVEWRRLEGGGANAIGDGRFVAVAPGVTRYAPVAIATSGESMEGDALSIAVKPRPLPPARASAPSTTPPASVPTREPPAPVSAPRLTVAEIEPTMQAAVRRAPNAVGKVWPDLGGFVMPVAVLTDGFNVIRGASLVETRVLDAGPSGTRFESTVRLTLAKGFGTTRTRLITLIGEANPRTGGTILTIREARIGLLQ